MMLDFYLSEMSVSDRHGGGLTLKRVLGDDLDNIRYYIHASRFALDYPVVDHLRSRCLNAFSPFESDAVRSKIGCRPARWLFQNAALSRWQGRCLAKKIAGLFSREKRDLRALVCPQNAASLHTMSALVRIRPVSYISWVMDDHLVAWSGGEWRYEGSQEVLFGSHLRAASRVFVISPAMREFYLKRFGVDSEVLFGPCDNAEVVSANQANGNAPTGISTATISVRQLRFGYFGALQAWQMDSLVLLGEQLAAIGASLEIYSDLDALPQELRRSGISLHGRIPSESVKEKMLCYDAVILPVSFRSELRHMSEFNIATKMSECLASGTVTLAIGPSYAAMIRFLEPTGAALLLTDVTGSGLIDIASKIRNPLVRQSLLDKACRLVDAELSTSAMRKRWTAALSALA